MELEMCPYCESRGLVLTIRNIPGGIEVSGRCTQCHYSYDSDYSSRDRQDDLVAEYSLPEEVGATD
ncbi:MAG TPA: hypothetical protein PK954_02610 [Anaerolineales bacterium]|nr:hypothetical protein [Anaerolineales bacterium]HRF49788.1 hypothetical protein [Anaerolineales bacterium]